MSYMKNALNYEAVARTRKPKTTSCEHYWKMTHFILLAEKQDCAFCCPTEVIAHMSQSHSAFLAFQCFPVTVYINLFVSPVQTLKAR